MASNYIVSRSDLVLDADHSLDLLGTYLVLQACISFGSVSNKTGAFLLVPCSHKNAVAHIDDSQQFTYGVFRE